MAYNIKIIETKLTDGSEVYAVALSDLEEQIERAGVVFFDAVSFKDAEEMADKFAAVIRDHSLGEVVQ